MSKNVLNSTGTQTEKLSIEGEKLSIKWDLKQVLKTTNFSSLHIVASAISCQPVLLAFALFSSCSVWYKFVSVFKPVNGYLNQICLG